MTFPPELKGWLLSVYPDEVDGAVVWILGDDGKRYRLNQPFPTTFYLSGEQRKMRGIRDDLQKLDPPPKTALVSKQDLYQGLLCVLMIQTDTPVAQERLFYRMQRLYKRVRYFDAKIPFPIRYSVTHKVFPMARCVAQADENQRLLDIHALDSPWDTIYDMPPFRVLVIEPDCNPQHAQPTCLQVTCGDRHTTLDLSDQRELLANIQQILDELDPDVIFARWGDSWLFPLLFETAKTLDVAFNPGRDPRQIARTIKESTFESYGSVYFRSRQTRLFGRWHIDPENTMMNMGTEIDMRSAIEIARVTSLDVQTASRNSPGAGFTAMQIREALGRGILIPLHKRQTERFKSAMDLNNADGGGLNYRPVIGVHAHVAELDFFSMYPSIMMTWNISGETVGVSGTVTRHVPDSGVPINQDVDGLVASVLKPLLEKRHSVKKAMKKLEEEDPRRHKLQSIADALKWLGYVSFGYQGYKNNLFGNIQAHEAICAIGRDTLVTALETAQEMGFKVLAGNVDSIFVQKAGAQRPQDFAPLIEEIHFRTGLIIELEGIFDWLIFTASKVNPLVGATNRYFGRYDHGGIKVRGMAQRRYDTPRWIADTQQAILELLAEEKEAKHVSDRVPEVIAFTQACITALNEEQVPIEDLICTTRLSRELQAYKGASTSAQAAQQLAEEGKDIRVGQTVKFIYTYGEKTSVLAWDLAIAVDYALINKQRYKDLLLRAVHQTLQPLGLEEEDLNNLVYDHVRQIRLTP
jgi:DNA polymerase II